MDPEVIITNIKKRYSGVSGTINALLPVQSKNLSIGFVGNVLPGFEIAQQSNPEKIEYLTLWRAILVSRKKLADGRPRIWHVRRDHEMMLAVFLRDVLRFPIKVVFTSAAKHLHSWFPRWLISKMDGVIATTEEAASFVPNTTIIAPHGISLGRFSPPTDKLNTWQRTHLLGKYGIGTFGRIREDKGSDIFVDAMIKLLPDYPDWSAVLAGLCVPKHQAFQEALQQRISAAGLSDRIVFLGVIGPDKIADWYQNVLITVACPRYEPFGLTPLEAMACGCAVVASDTGAFSTIVDEGVTGYVVPTDDVDALVEAIRKIMNPTDAIKMGTLGRDRVAEKFTVELEAENIARVYSKLWSES